MLAAISALRDAYQNEVATYTRGESNPDEFKRKIFEAIDLPVALFPYVFGYIKFFDPELPEEHPDNYYMEREWRILGEMKFDVSDVKRILIPSDCAGRFRDLVPEYRGKFTELP